MGSHHHPTLSHEVFEHPVENGAVIITFQAELDKVAHRLWGLLGPQLYVKITQAGSQHRLRDVRSADGLEIGLECQFHHQRIPMALRSSGTNLSLGGGLKVVDVGHGDTFPVEALRLCSIHGTVYFIVVVPMSPGEDPPL